MLFKQRFNGVLILRFVNISITWEPHFLGKTNAFNIAGIGNPPLMAKIYLCMLFCNKYVNLLLQIMGKCSIIYILKDFCQKKFALK